MRVTRTRAGRTETAEARLKVAAVLAPERLLALVFHYTVFDGGVRKVVVLLPTVDGAGKVYCCARDEV